MLPSGDPIRVRVQVAESAATAEQTAGPADVGLGSGLHRRSTLCVCGDSRRRFGGCVLADVGDSAQVRVVASWDRSDADSSSSPSEKSDPE